MRGFRNIILSAALLCLCTGAAFSGEDPAPPTPPQSVKMNFKDTPLETVLDQLSEMSGLVIIKDFILDGRISIISKQPMNVDDAIALLNSVLKEKGYVGIRTGRILKLVKLDEAKKRNIPVHTGSDPNKIEATDEVITQVIQIKYIDAQQLKRDFTPLIPSYADLSANVGSNSLILTDTGANVRRIVNIIRAMDTQSTTVAEVKVFQLKFANATNAARLITDLFQEDANTQRNQQNLPPWMRGGATFGRGGGGGGGGERGAGGGSGEDAQSARIKKVTASADERTNSVVVSASPDVMTVIQSVITDLDSNPTEEQSVFIYHCKNAQAANLESVVNSLFGTGSTSGTLNRSNTGSRTNTGRGSNVQRSQSGSRFGGNNTSSGSGRTGSGFGQGGQQGGNQFGGNFFGQNNNNNNSSRSGSALRPSMVGGDATDQVFIVADIDSNSLMVLTSPRNFDRVRGILEDLDRPVPQVLIKVLIVEVTHDKSSDIGVDASVLTKGAIEQVTTNMGNAAATDGLVAKLLVSNLSATLHALEGFGKLDILSRPYILASDNQLSSITVGQEVPFVVSSRTTDTGQTINTIQYQDIGIILNVTAHINNDGLVIMDVAPEVSSLTGTTVPISENVNAPVFARRSAQTRVAIKNGETIVIGGLMEDRKTETVKGVPFLNRIPGLGTLFRRKTTDKSKTELLIFLTPHVALDPGQLLPMTEDEKTGLQLTPKAVRKGAFDEHLEGMERGKVVPIPRDEPVQIPPVEPRRDPDK